MAFKMDTLWNALWPEIGGVGVLIGSHIIAVAVDASMVWDKPFRNVNDWVHVAVVLGGGYMMGSNKGGDTTKAVFYADVGLLGQDLGQILYDKLVSPSVARSRGRRTAEGYISEGNRSAQVLAARRAAARRNVATDYVGPGPTPGKTILA